MRLKDLLNLDRLRQSLPEILASILSSDNMRRAALDLIRRRAHLQVGRTGARHFARCLHKLVAAAMGPHIGAGAADRVRIGQALAESIAVQGAQAIDALLAFAAAQAERERTRDAEASIRDAAVAARELAEKRVEEAFIDLVRVASGDPPKDL